VLIGIAQEQASVWRSWPRKGQQKAAHPHMDWGREMAYINYFYFYFYFYLWDAEWGRQQTQPVNRRNRRVRKRGRGVRVEPWGLSAHPREAAFPAGEVGPDKYL